VQMTDPHGNRSLKRLQHQAARLFISCIGAPFMFFLILCGSADAEQPVEVRVDVEEREVYLGESFIYRLQVIGGGHVGTPDMSRFEDFDVREFPKAWLRYRGTDWLDPNTLDLGTSYFFRLVALRTGLLTLPSFTFALEGQGIRGRADSAHRSMVFSQGGAVFSRDDSHTPAPELHRP